MLTALSIMPGPKFTCHIHPSFSGEPEARCCGATAGVQSRLRNDARRGVPGEAANRWMRLSGSGAVSNYSALQRRQKTGPESGLIGWVIDEVFMQRRRDGVLDGGFYNVGSEARA